VCSPNLPHLWRRSTLKGFVQVKPNSSLPHHHSQSLNVVSQPTQNLSSLNLPRIHLFSPTPLPTANEPTSVTAYGTDPPPPILALLDPFSTCWQDSIVKLDHMSPRHLKLSKKTQIPYCSIQCPHSWLPHPTSNHSPSGLPQPSLLSILPFSQNIPNSFLPQGFCTSWAISLKLCITSCQSDQLRQTFPDLANSISYPVTIILF
jgi:hypothetical protein